MKILRNYPLAKETTFLCGGSAKWYCEVNNYFEFCNLLKWHRGKYYILGAGSKTLCVDEGFDGLVISTKKLNKIELFDENNVICDCGVKFGNLQSFCVKHGLSGLEWSAGIPASVGGAVVMNAGAFGKEFCDVVDRVEIFENGTTKILRKSEINFSYRNSSLKNKNVLRVWLRFEKKSFKIVKKGYELFYKKKFASQPEGVGSAGSVFKRKEDVIPAKIIDKLGLKGVKIGGAEISSQHSGFIVNNRNATATDVVSLISLVESEVKKKYGIVLEKELMILE